MGKLLISGVGGNLGKEAARILLTLEDKSNLIFCATSESTLKPYADMGIETHVVDYNHPDKLEEAFKNAEVAGIISMPFVGKKRENAHKNALDAAKKAGVKKLYILHYVMLQIVKILLLKELIMNILKIMLKN
jgi:NAD(P)H dehydrogenase (quinone)